MRLMDNGDTVSNVLSHTYVPKQKGRNVASLSSSYDSELEPIRRSHLRYIDLGKGM